MIAYERVLADLAADRMVALAPGLDDDGNAVVVMAVGTPLSLPDGTGATALQLERIALRCVIQVREHYGIA